MPRKQPTEHQEQCALIEWARTRIPIWPEIEYIYSVPNGAKLPYKKTRGGKRYSREANWLLKEGMLPGVSDIVVPAPRGVYHSLYLELKVGYNKPTEKQLWFLNGVSQFGFATAVAWGFEQAKEIITAYMQLQPGEKLDHKHLSYTRRKS
jgi:hypothetical protein